MIVRTLGCAHHMLTLDVTFNMAEHPPVILVLVFSIPHYPLLFYSSGLLRLFPPKSIFLVTHFKYSAAVITIILVNF